MLDPYVPSAEERSDPAVFAKNVWGLMAADLGVADNKARGWTPCHIPTPTLHARACLPAHSLARCKGIGRGGVLTIACRCGCWGALLQVFTAEEARAFYREADAREAAREAEGKAKKLG